MLKILVEFVDLIYDILLYIMDKHTYKHLFKQFTIQTSKNIIGHE